jgi:2,5-diamino-6-(ribosylamino)-4(3H)-pyrimidinone 5'-phosphate reductase
MLPRVILHNSISLDSRNTLFTPDLGVHYELVGKFNMDVHLAGSNTLANPIEPIPPEDDSVFKPPKKEPNDTRPLLVVPDSRGIVRSWHAVRSAPFWAEHIALCTKTTPKEYLEYLDKRYINHIIIGDDHVDLKAALELLNEKYGAKTVLLDSGGTLNGVMLRAGLVDEVSLLIHPVLLGGTKPKPFFKSEDFEGTEEIITLKLMNCEKMGDLVWLRYEVIK